MKLFGLDQKGIGSDLKAAREHIGLTLKQVASDSGVAVSHIWNLENGVKEMSLEKFFALCSSLGLSGGKIIADNFQFDQSACVNIILEAVKVSNPNMDEMVRLVWSNYLSAFCVIISHMLLSESMDAFEGFEYPTDAIGDAFRGLCGRLAIDMPLRERRDCLINLEANPLGVLNILGLMDMNLFSGFVNRTADDKKKGNGLKPWLPVRKKTVSWFTSGMATNAMANIDPQVFGRMEREVKEIGFEAFMDKSLKKTKSKSKGKK